MSTKIDTQRYFEAYAAVVGVIAYGLMWAGDFDPVYTYHSELRNFLACSGLIAMFVIPVALASMIERFIIMVVLGIGAGATIIGGVIMLAVGMSNFFKRLDTFIERLPFAFTCAAVYLSAWRVPPILWRQAQHWPLPIWLSATLIGLAAIVCLLLLALVGLPFGFSYKLSLFLTLVWGWYFVFALYLSLTLFGDD